MYTKLQYIGLGMSNEEKEEEDISAGSWISK